MKEKVTFKDLSGPLKTAIIMAWIIGVIYVFYFIIGMIIGILEAI